MAWKDRGLNLPEKFEVELVVKLLRVNGSRASPLLRRGKSATLTGMSRAPDYEKIAAEVEAPLSEEPKLSPRGLRADRTYLPLDHPKYEGIAAAKGYKQDDYSGNRLQRVHYSHEAMIDILIAEPTITQNELARRFDRSVGWISIVMGSDAFQAALAKRRDDLLDPEWVATMEERFKGLAAQSIAVISKNLEKDNPSMDVALKALEISSKAAGFGARSPGGNTQNNQFVIQLPGKSANADDWAAEHAPMKRIGNG